MRYLVTILLIGCVYGATAQTADVLPDALVSKKWRVTRLQKLARIPDNELSYQFKRGKQPNLDVAIKGDRIITRNWYDLSIPGEPRIAIQEPNKPPHNYRYVNTRYTDKGKKEHIFFEYTGFRQRSVNEQMRLEQP